MCAAVTQCVPISRAHETPLSGICGNAVAQCGRWWAQVQGKTETVTRGAAPFLTRHWWATLGHAIWCVAPPSDTWPPLSSVSANWMSGHEQPTYQHAPCHNLTADYCVPVSQHFSASAAPTEERREKCYGLEYGARTDTTKDTSGSSNRACSCTTSFGCSGGTYCITHFGLGPGCAHPHFNLSVSCLHLHTCPGCAS